MNFTTSRNQQPLSYSRNAGVARVLLAAGADVQHADCLGMTALFYAAEDCDAETVAVLLSAGAKADTLPVGLSPLHFARNAETVRLLAGAGADVNAHGKYFPLPPLMSGEDEGRQLALLAAGADACFRTADGWTALHFPQTESVMLALLAAGADADARAGRMNFSPLHLALPDTWEVDEDQSRPQRPTLEFLNDELENWENLKEDEEYYGYFMVSNTEDRAARFRIVSALLAAGASADAITRTGVAPLHLAVDAPTLKVLLDAGANVHALTLSGQSPLHYARDVASLELLVAAGADVKQKDANGETALFFAKDAACATWLLEKMKAAGMNPKVFLNEETKYGRAVLEVLCEHRSSMYSEAWTEGTKAWLDAMQGLTRGEVAEYRARVEDFSQEAMLRVLLDAGADVNRRDRGGCSAAFYAKELGTLELLKEYGVDFTITDNGETLLTNSYHKTPEVVRFLVDEGVDVNAISNDGKSALAAYCISDAESIKILLDAGANPNPQTLTSQKNVELPLLLHKDPEPMRLLIEAGADVNAKDRSGKAPLHLVTEYGRAAEHVLSVWMEKAKLLLEAGADVDARNNDGKTPLFEVLNKPELVKLFIDAGADVNAKDNRDVPLLYYAENLEVVKLLLAAGADENALPSGQTLLHTVWNQEVVEYLLAQGADVNARDNWGRTPLFRKPVEVTKLLLEAGADVNARNNDGNTPLFLASEDTIPLLLAAGADVHVENAKGEQVLHCRANPQKIRLLLAAGADPNARDNEGQTPLFYMVRHGAPDAVRLLLEAGTDANARDKDGKTPLFQLLSSYFRIPIADVLLEFGAEVNTADNDLRTPLDYMIQSSTGVQWLLEHGADPNLADTNGETPLFRVREREIYKLLLDAGANPHHRNRQGQLATSVRQFGLDGKLGEKPEAKDDDDDDDDDFDDDLGSLGTYPDGSSDVMRGFMESEAVKHGVPAKGGVVHADGF